MTTQDIMEQVQADYITAHSPLTPVVKAGSERTDQLHGLERRNRAELSDADSVPVTTQGRVARRSLRWATHSPIPIRARRAPPSRRAPGSIQSRPSPPWLERRRVAEDAGDREAPAVDTTRDAPSEHALDPVGVLLDPRRRLLAHPVDAVVAPPVRRALGDLLPRRRRGRARVSQAGAACRPRKRLTYAAGERAFSYTVDPSKRRYGSPW